MIPRDIILDRNPLDRYLAAIGHDCNGGGDKVVAKCPFHDDKTPSMSVNLKLGLFHCFVCDIGGTVIDMHMRLNGLSVKDAINDLAHKAGLVDENAEKPQKEATYVYRDAFGREVMRVDRIVTGTKKKFRQYTVAPDGKETNGIDGVARVLFRMERWAGKEEVALCEGEKCVAALEAMGMNATTNPGGSSGWCDAYAQFLKDKRVELWPDNDEPGEKWLQTVLRSLEGKVHSLRIMRVPHPYNDIADMVIAKGVDDATESVLKIAEASAWIDKGVQLPLLSAREAYDHYRQTIKQSSLYAVDLGKWLPSFKSWSRPLMPGDMMVFLADTGVGKCLGYGVPVRMYDGSTKEVQEICVGDLLMGPDSLPRTVLALHGGADELFKIDQRNGDSFVCNREHILCLKSVNNPSRKRVGGRDVEVSIKDYLGWTTEQKHIHKAFKVGVDYPCREVPLDPYWIGLWLGDGSSRSTAVTVADADCVIADWLTDWAQANGMKTRKARRGESLCQTWNFSKAHKNKILKDMKALGIIGNKHIPQIYMINDRETRLEVLAGLIDSDGYLTKTNVAQVCGVNSVLIHQCADLARGLGFRCSVKSGTKRIKSIGYETTAYTCTISGPLACIPVRESRKRGVNSTQKDHLRTGFSVNPIGRGNYYGFELDGDGRFLLGDYTVTHNTALLLNLAYSQRPLACVFFELELASDAMVERFIARDTGTETLEVENRTRRGEMFDVSGWSNVYLCPESKMDGNKMADIIERSELKIGKRPAIILVDYIGLMDGGSGKRYERMSAVAEEMKRLARSTNTVVVVASQVSRKEDRLEIDLHAAKDSGSVENSAQLVIGAWRPKIDVMTLRILKQTRRAGIHDVHCIYDGNRQTIREAVI